MMRATRPCACAQPPHTLQNAISANASIAAHSVRTAALGLSSEVANRGGLPIRLSLKRSSLSLSIARAPYRVPVAACVCGDVGGPLVLLYVRRPHPRGVDRRRFDAGGPNTRGLDAGS